MGVDRHKRQKEEESYQQVSLWTLHVGSGWKPAQDSLSNTAEVRSRWISLEKKKTQLSPPPFSYNLVQRPKEGEREGKRWENDRQVGWL